jgi:hypothetical protein
VPDIDDGDAASELCELPEPFATCSEVVLILALVTLAFCACLGGFDCVMQEVKRQGVNWGE